MSEVLDRKGEGKEQSNERDREGEESSLLFTE